MKVSANVLVCGMCVAPIDWQTNNVPTPYRLYYVNGGNAFFRINNEEFALKKGHFYLFPSSLPFLIRQDPENRLDHLYYNFVLSPSMASVEPVCCSLDEHPTFPYFLEIMKKTINDYVSFKTPELKENVSHVLEAFLSVLFTVKPLVKSQNDIVLKSIEYMETHFNENISVKDIASFLYLNEDYFIRKFKSVMNLTPYAYLSRLRVCIARELISEGMSLKDAAEATGYQYPSSLCHAMKKYDN